MRRIPYTDWERGYVWVVVPLITKKILGSEDFRGFPATSTGIKVIVREQVLELIGEKWETQTSTKEIEQKHDIKLSIKKGKTYFHDQTNNQIVVLDGLFEHIQVFIKGNKRLCLLTNTNGKKQWYVWHPGDEPFLIQDGYVCPQGHTICSIRTGEEDAKTISRVDGVAYIRLDAETGNISFHGISMDGETFPVRKVPKRRWGVSWIAECPINSTTYKTSRRKREIAKEMAHLF